MYHDGSLAAGKVKGCVRPSRARRGFTLLEVVLALGLFGLVLVIFGATFPQTLRGSGQAAKYMQAALLARHKIDQIRQAGFSHLNGSDLQQLGITDSATANSDGSYSFTVTDHLVTSGTAQGYFGAAANAQGTIAIGSALPNQGSSAPSSTLVKQVTITISWSGGGVHAGSFATHTLIARS